MRRGLTLIEVVVALAIASVIFSAVFLLYRTTAATALRQHEREAVAFAPAAAFAALRDDVRALIPSRFATNNRLELATTLLPSGDPASRLVFAAWQLDPTNRGSLWNEALRVEWSIHGAGTPTAALARVASGLTGPAGRFDATNVLLERVASFQVLLHDGSNWMAKWPPADGTARLLEPQSVRISLGMRTDGGATNWSTDYWIPTGLVVTSSTLRSSAVAPL